jgi:hypothetical protein
MPTSGSRPPTSRPRPWRSNAPLPLVRPDYYLEASGNCLLMALLSLLGPRLSRLTTTQALPYRGNGMPYEYHAMLGAASLRHNYYVGMRPEGGLESESAPSPERKEKG